MSKHEFHEIEWLAKCLGCEWQGDPEADGEQLHFDAEEHICETGHRVIIQAQIRGASEGRVAVGKVI